MMHLHTVVVSFIFSNISLQEQVQCPEVSKDPGQRSLCDIHDGGPVGYESLQIGTITF